MSYYYHPGQQPGFYQPAPPVQPPPPSLQPVAGATVGENGLYVAPADLDEDLEVHPATQFVKLNVMESGKYAEMWVEATSASPEFVSSSAKHETMISGKGAVAFLGRAANVTRPQLRLIWSIADHTERGALHQGEFNVALRLVALAQRGAELSENGLRNFSGIQLIPEIKEVDRAPPQPVSVVGTTSTPTTSTDEAPVTSIWSISAEDAERYERFFVQTDTAGSGYIDGLQGVAFFSRSGLPKEVLKVVWGLADITKDGKLDRDEFRNAFRLVSMLKRGHVSVDQLPPALDPAGPFWVRVEQSADLPSNPGPPSNDVSAQTGNDSLLGDFVSAPSPLAGGITESIASEELLGGFAPPPTPATGAPPAGVGGDSDVLGFGTPAPSPSVPSQGAGGPAQLSAWQEDPNALRDQLRSATVSEQRAKRQLEEMQAEMERLRLEKAQVHNKTAVNELEVKEMREAYQDMMAAKAQAERRALELERDRQAERDLGADTASSPKPQPPSAPANQDSSFVLGNESEAAPVIQEKPAFSMPSESAPASASQARAQTSAPRRDSLASSSDDDDNDFWGASGSLKPPPMGSIGVSAPAAKQNSGPQDDDWTF